MKTLFSFLFFCLVALTQVRAQAYWQLVDNNQYGQFFAMTDNGNVYAMRNSTALQVSTMDGAYLTWSQLTGYPYIYGNQLSSIGNNVIVTNSNNNTYAGRGIYLSADNGVTWAKRNTGLGADTNVVFAWPMANGVLIAHTQQSASSHKLYRSTNLVPIQ